MRKAVFMDYNGTIIREGGKEMEEILARICRGSDLHTPEEAVNYWYRNLGIMEQKYYGENFISEEEIVTALLRQCREEIHLQDNPEEFKELFRGYWANAPVFEDAEIFIKSCPLPVYVLTNNSVPYVKRCLDRSHLKPAGIITADMARAYKPHREVFLKALEISGCRPEEVIHVGDSLESDVKGARSVGITPVLVDRRGKHEGGGLSVRKDINGAPGTFRGTYTSSTLAASSRYFRIVRCCGQRSSHLPHWMQSEGLPFFSVSCLKRRRTFRI